MIYNKKDLRNNNSPLLSRLQRKVDLVNENKVKVFEAKKFEKEKKKEMKFSQGLALESFEEDCDFKLVKTNNSKLHLYNKRGKR